MIARGSLKTLLEYDTQFLRTECSRNFDTNTYCGNLLRRYCSDLIAHNRVLRCPALEYSNTEKHV